MPFVFVHGVNVRKDSDYDRDCKLRDAFLQEIVAPKVGINPTHEIITPYWGTKGTKFWKDLQVIPNGRELETFGSKAELPPSLGIAIADQKIAGGDTLETISQKDPPLAIDLLFDAAVSVAESESDIRELARGYAVAHEKFELDREAWLSKAGTEAIADQVYEAARKKSPGTEQFGGNKLWQLLDGASEIARRTLMKAPSLASQASVDLVRKPLTRKIGTFIGDAFHYLNERGDGKVPGPIASIVLNDLNRARQIADETSEPLIVICHSFGGEILYDILTHYAEGSALQVDHWVTVGSQVGLFEEMSLFLNNRDKRDKRDNEAIPAPQRAKRWTNIIDTNDVLGFIVLPVFTGGKTQIVRDFKYDSGYPATGAHSGYFEWASFYRRLADRIS